MPMSKKKHIDCMGVLEQYELVVMIEGTLFVLIFQKKIISTHIGLRDIVDYDNDAQQFIKGNVDSLLASRIVHCNAKKTHKNHIF